MKFQQWLGPFHMDWRTMMPANEILRIFQECWHIYYSWKIVQNPFSCMVVLQSMWKYPFSSFKYGTDLSPRYDTHKDLSTWIGEKQCMQMVFWQFSRNNTFISIPGKFARSLFACMVVLQSMCKGPNHCWNFMESGSDNISFIGLTKTPSDLPAPALAPARVPALGSCWQTVKNTEKN